MAWDFDDVQSGEQYTSDLMPRFGTNTTKPTSQEKSVRPFESFRERRDQRLAQLRLPPDVDNTATACWGGTTTFEEPDASGNTGGGGFNTKDRDDQDRSQEDPIGEEWNEIQRDAVKIRVESAEDTEVFVIIAVATGSVIEVPALTVSRVTGTGNKKQTLSFTIPQRQIRVKWVGTDESRTRYS